METWVYILDDIVPVGSTGTIWVGGVLLDISDEQIEEAFELVWW